MCGYAVHDTDDQNHGHILKIQWFLLNEICTDTHLLASCGGYSSRKFSSNLDGKKVPNCECLFVHRTLGLFLSGYVDDIIMTGKTQNFESFEEEIDEAGRSWTTNQLHFLTTKIWDALNANASRTKVSLRRTKIVLKTVAWSYDMEGHAKKCVERCCALANKETEQLHKDTSPYVNDNNLKKIN